MTSNAFKDFYKIALKNYLYLKLGRKPTDDEMLAEARLSGVEYFINPHVIEPENWVNHGIPDKTKGYDAPDDLDEDALIEGGYKVSKSETGE